MEFALIDMLKSSANLHALVANRIYPLERPQGSPYPAIVFQRVGGFRDRDMEGATGLIESRFLISCWAQKIRRKSAYLIAKNMRSLVLDVLLPDGGFMETVGTTQVQSVFVNDENDSRTDGATGTGAVRVLLDCTIWHKEI